MKKVEWVRCPKCGRREPATYVLGQACMRCGVYMVRDK